jgi:hypothetical protein
MKMGQYIEVEKNVKLYVEDIGEGNLWFLFTDGL